MSGSAIGVVAGLVGLAARSRARGVAWPATLAVTLCAGAACSVFDLAQTSTSWRASLAFALLGAAAWLETEPKLLYDARLSRPLELAAVVVAGLLQPSWLPAALALVASRYVAALSNLRQRTVLVSLAVAGGVAVFAAGGQALLCRVALAFRESWVRAVPDIRHENATLATALAVILIAALLARAAATQWQEQGEVPGAFWLLALAGELIVLGARAPDPELRAVLPLLLALALIPSVGRASSPHWLPRSALAGLSALAVAAANGLLPSGLRDEPELARATRLRAAFGHADVLIFPDRPSFELTYYADLPSVALSALLRRAPRGNPLAGLELVFDRASAAGHGVWLNVDAAGQPLLGAVVVDAKELGRIVWGVTVGSGELRLREVRALASAPPCAAPAVPGANASLRASANAFVESDLSRDYAPERALDGNAKTEWLTPAGHMPWLDVSLNEPRPLRGVRLLGGRNLPYRDFETRTARVDLYLETRMIASSEVTLVGGQWRPVALAADRVDCVRILVLSHRGRGGGLAEVELF